MFKQVMYAVLLLAFIGIGEGHSESDGYPGHSEDDHDSLRDVKDEQSCSGASGTNDDCRKDSHPEDSIYQPDLSKHNDATDPSLSEFESIEATSALIDSVNKAKVHTDAVNDELNRALEEIQRLKQIRDTTLTDIHDDLSNVDKVFFESYSLNNYDIHETMLMDVFRTQAYRDFIMNNPQLFKGKLVLDVGCGTGILSLFAASAGAKHVVAVDYADIIYKAMDIARENRLHDKITFVKGKIEHVKLPVEKFDIIISEWMGHFLLQEGVLSTLIWARDHLLLPGGHVYPDHYTISIVGVNDEAFRYDKYEFWDDVYGFKMSAMKSHSLKTLQIDTIPPEAVVTEPAVIKNIDIMTCTYDDQEFSFEFSLKSLETITITAIGGYFDVEFVSNCEKITLSTGPRAPLTHWGHAIMILPDPILLDRGSLLEGTLTYKKAPGDPRGIWVTLKIEHELHQYTMFT